MIDKAHLESELTDARAHRDQANAALIQHNAAAQKCQQDVIGYSYAEQQLLALLKKLDEEAPAVVESAPTQQEAPTQSSPAPTPITARKGSR